MEVKMFKIIRNKNWLNMKVTEISQKEWEEYIHNDTSIEKVNSSHFDTIYQWKGISKVQNPSIHLMHGTLCFIGPDRMLLEKMITIANDLNAVVIDQQGKTYKKVSDIPHEFDNNLDTQLEKDKSNTQKMINRIPRCVHNFKVLDNGTNEKFTGGHGEPINVYYHVGCKECESNLFHVNGYYWFNDHYKKEFFVAPLSLICCLCNNTSVIYNPVEHGYDPEACDFPGTDFSQEKGTHSALFECPGCNKDSLEVSVWFSYPDDIFDEEFQDFSGREQDLFTWITFEGRCANCNEVISIADFECA